jgi:hypothetical protein
MRRERESVAEGASNLVMNLSGKKTLTGRVSGECRLVRPPTRKAARSNFQVTGQGSLLYSGGFLSIFMKTKGGNNTDYFKTYCTF